MIEIRHKETGLVLHRVRRHTLAGARLRGKQLAGADMRRVDLRRAALYRVDLTAADLEGAVLTRVRGSGPEFQALGWLVAPMLLLPAFLATASTLGGAIADPMISMLFAALAILTPFMLGPTLLIRVHGFLGAVDLLAGRPQSVWPVNLASAILRGADLSKADLCESNLTGADLSEAILQDTRLARSLFRLTSLRNAVLRGALLAGADLRGADLRQADLRHANLCYADLREADLRGTDLRGQLIGVKLHGARYDETTRWPMGFQPSRHGCVVPTEAVPATAPVGRGDEITVAGLPSEGRDEDERGQDGRWDWN